MEKCKHERGAIEIDGNAGSITDGVLNEAGIARRSFLGRIGGWSAAVAMSVLGPEVLMQVVSGRSMMSSALAAGGTRDRRLHPFPSDDPFNIPLNVNVWYTPPGDPATDSVRNSWGQMTVNNGWSHPIYFPTTSDPMTTFSVYDGNCAHCRAESYRPEENGQRTISERLQTWATPANPPGSWKDAHLHIMIDNELVESFVFERQGGINSGISNANTWRTVRNRLDRYCFAGFGHPMENRAGVRAWGGSAVAGLIRKHEVEKANPHIPHALSINMSWFGQIGSRNQGSSSSPLYSVPQMFPASTSDYPNGYPVTGGRSAGPVRMGMRFALDPAVCTDSWINANAPNIYQRAIAYALRDYGCIVCDETESTNVLAGEQGIASNIESQMMNWNWCRPYLRRVAGAGPVHNPTISDWQTWANNQQGWGGGAPRVPYSPPLASLSGSPPSPAPPGAPPAIEVTGAGTFDGTG